MSAPAVRRLLAIAWLVSWLVPPLAALGVVLHLAGHHHGHGHGHGHEDADHGSLELAAAATHGHSHELSSTQHDHRGVQNLSFAPTVPPAAFVADGTVALPGARRVDFGTAPPPTGSPPLFRSHCALLL